MALKKLYLFVTFYRIIKKALFLLHWKGDCLQFTVVMTRSRGTAPHPISSKY